RSSTTTTRWTPSPGRATRAVTSSPARSARRARRSRASSRSARGAPSPRARPSASKKSKRASKRSDAAERLEAQPVIREHDGHHRLGHRHEAREETGIVPALGADLRRASLAVDRVLLAGEAARRLHRRAEDDGHPARDPAEHSAVAVGAGAHATVRVGLEDVVVLAAAERGHAEAGARLHAEHRREAEEGFAEIGAELVEDGLAEARGDPTR